MGTSTMTDIQAVSEAVLDFEYLKILRIMKPYITCIMNNHYIELVRVWLEKLSDPICDKIQRNVYLFQLGKQVEDGYFSEPFINPPPEGNLKGYQEEWGDIVSEESKDKKSKDSELIENQQEDKVIWQYFPFTKSSLTYTAWNNNIRDTNITNKFFQQVNSKAENDISELESSVLPKLNNMSNGNREMTDCAVSQLKSDRQLSMSHMNGVTITENTNVKNNDKFIEMKAKLDKFEENMLNMQQESSNINGRNRKMITTICQSHNNATPSDYVTNNPDLFRLNLTDLQCESPVKRDEVTSSWCDMSEDSTNSDTRQASGDGRTSTGAQVGDSRKVSELLEIIDELRRENFMLGQQVDKMMRFGSNNQNSATEISIQNLVGEVESLKNRLQELVDVKSNLQNNHVVLSAAWQDNMSNLNKKLRNAQKKNSDLKKTISILETQLKEEQGKSEKCTKKMSMKISNTKFKELESRLMETIAKKDAEISEINTKYEREILQRHNDFQMKLINMQNDKYDVQKNCDDQTRDLTANYETQIVAITEHYERNIADMKNEFRIELNCKENEIERLETLVQDQCGRMRGEVQQIRKQLEEANKTENEDQYLEKIEFLQKCILKMEKLYVKSERDFQKQLSKLRKDLDLRDKQNQIQLHTQKAGYVTNRNVRNLSDIDSIINKLEGYYKNLIVKQQEQATAEKRSDSIIISQLREQLIRFGNLYNMPERA